MEVDTTTGHYLESNAKEHVLHDEGRQTRGDCVHDDKQGRPHLQTYADSAWTNETDLP